MPALKLFARRTLSAALLLLSMSAGAADPAPMTRRLWTLQPAVELRAGDRLTVLYFPNLGGCTPHAAAIHRALELLIVEPLGIRVVTVLPIRSSESTAPSFPGDDVEIPAEEWLRLRKLAPTPRVEVWSSVGELLLLRSLPPNIAPEELRREILWARAFTEEPTTE